MKLSNIFAWWIEEDWRLKLVNKFRLYKVKTFKSWRMVFLSCLMVLALTIIPSVKSQEGNFAQFGFNVRDANFKNSEPKGANSRYVEWNLRKDIPVFGGEEIGKIRVSKCLWLSNRRSYNYHYYFNRTQRLLIRVVSLKFIFLYSINSWSCFTFQE